MRALGIFFLVLVGVAIAFSILFPMFAKAKTGRGERFFLQRARDEERKRIQEFVIPIMDAINEGSVAGVKAGLQRYKPANPKEDYALRLQVAKFYIKQGLLDEAHQQLDAVLFWQNFPSPVASGEVMSLWLETNPTPAEREGELARWRKRAALYAKQMHVPSDWSTVAMAKYLQADELRAKGEDHESLLCYKRVTKLAPKSSYAWYQYGLSLIRAREYRKAKKALIYSYFLAPASDRAKVKEQNMLSDLDIKSPPDYEATAAPAGMPTR